MWEETQRRKAKVKAIILRLIVGLDIRSIETIRLLNLSAIIRCVQIGKAKPLFLDFYLFALPILLIVGYLEDRRPASNMDPYVVTALLAETTILWEPTLEAEALAAQKLALKV